MGKFVGKAEAEKIVLNYLNKNTRNRKDFNPSLLTSREIARNTDLDEDIVDETLEALSEGVVRVEKAQCNFEFWLPATEEAEKLKERLFASNIAFSNVALFSFISVVVLFYLLKFIVNKNWITLNTNAEFFFAGVILTALSISIAKKVTNKYYLLSQRIQRVPHFKVYAWLFVIFTSIIVFMLNQNLESGPLVEKALLYISILANIVTIVAFFINILRKVK